MNDAPQPAFVGWRRTGPKGKWFAIATGATRPACWDALLRAATGSGESMVLEAGRDPDERAPFRRGVR